MCNKRYIIKNTEDYTEEELKNFNLRVDYEDFDFLLDTKDMEVVWADDIAIYAPEDLILSRSLKIFVDLLNEHTSA